MHRLRTHPLGVHHLHSLVHAGRIAHAGHEKPLQGRAASQRLRQGGDIGRGLACFRLHVREGLKAPRCLSTRPETAAFGSGCRGQHKGQARVLKPVAHPRAPTLQLLAEGYLGRGMFQDIGDTMAHSAAPSGPIGGRKEGLDDALLALGAAGTPDVRGPPTALAKREEKRVDPFTVPWLAQAQAKDLNLFQRQRLALADGRAWAPQPDEGCLAPPRHRQSGAAPPRRIAVARRLLSAMEAETHGPPTTCRAVRHPRNAASRNQKKCTANVARGAERAGTVQPQRERPRTQAISDKNFTET